MFGSIEDIVAKMFELGYDRDEIEDKMAEIISERHESEFFHEETIEDLKAQHKIVEESGYNYC